MIKQKVDTSQKKCAAVRRDWNSLNFCMGGVLLSFDCFGPEMVSHGVMWLCCEFYKRLVMELAAPRNEKIPRIDSDFGVRKRGEPCIDLFSVLGDLFGP